MAYYENLPVYKTAYGLLMQIYRLTGNMGRAYRYTLGERIQNEITELMLNVYRANSVYDKTVHLKKARENIIVVRLLFRIAHESRQVGLKTFVSVSEEIESVSKQLTAWEKSMTKQNRSAMGQTH